MKNIVHHSTSLQHVNLCTTLEFISRYFNFDFTRKLQNSNIKPDMQFQIYITLGVCNLFPYISICTFYFLSLVRACVMYTFKSLGSVRFFFCF